MSRQTAPPPPKPVAALLSPVLWQMEHPDKFDMYSVGVLFLQMAFPNLRSDNSLIAFNRRLQELGWDLRVSNDLTAAVLLQDVCIDSVHRHAAASPLYLPAKADCRVRQQSCGCALPACWSHNQAVRHLDRSPVHRDERSAVYCAVGLEE